MQKSGVKQPFTDNDQISLFDDIAKLVRAVGSLTKSCFSSEDLQNIGGQFWIFFFKNMFDSLSLDCCSPQFWTVVDRGRLRLFGKYFAKLFHNIWQNNFTICFTGCCDVAPGCTSVGHDIAHLSKIAKWHLILYRMRLVDHPSGVMELTTATTAQMLAKYVAKKPNMQQTPLTIDCN